MVFALFNIHWVVPRRVIDLFECWQGRLGRHQNFVIWRAIPHCLIGVYGGSAMQELLRGVNKVLLS